ncbi:MAG: hypothetical protein AAFR87_12465, partial [Bacteroidota bacterium]
RHYQGICLDKLLQRREIFVEWKTKLTRATPLLKSGQEKKRAIINLDICSALLNHLQDNAYVQTMEFSRRIWFEIF